MQHAIEAHGRSESFRATIERIRCHPRLIKVHNSFRGPYRAKHNRVRNNGEYTSKKRVDSHDAHDKGSAVLGIASQEFRGMKNAAEVRVGKFRSV